MAEPISIEAFTDEARSFLEANADRRPPTAEFVWGQGSDDVGMFDEKDREVEAREAGGQGVAPDPVRSRVRVDHGTGAVR